MKIKFLGTSHGAPTPGRHCQSVLIETEQGDYLFDDGNLKVTAVHSDHMKASTDICFGFLVEGEGKRVYITGDLHPSLNDFPTELLSEPTDALITECAHFSAEELVAKLHGVNAKNIMVVHVNPSSRYQDLQEVCSRYPELPVCYPNDGDTYQI